MWTQSAFTVLNLIVLANCSPHGNSRGDGDIVITGARLSYGHEGFIEVYDETRGVWGTVCRTRTFFQNEADATCRMIYGHDATGFRLDSNFYDHVAMYPHNSTYDSLPVLIDSIKCDRQVTTLNDCTRGPIEDPENHDCEDRRLRSQSIRCFPVEDPDADEGDLRIIFYGNPDEGYLQMFHDGNWGSIFRDHFNHKQNEVTLAQVACRQMGYRFGAEALNKVTGSYEWRYQGQFSVPRWLQEINCVGNESRLIDCPHQPWGEDIYSNSELFQIICAGRLSDDDNTAETIEEGSLAVMKDHLQVPEKGEDTVEGALMVFHNGIWGHVSGPDVVPFINQNYIEASVACHGMGYHYGEILNGRGYEERYLSPVIWFTVNRCSGYEKRLADCPRDPGHWNHDKDVYIRCSMDVPYGIEWEGMAYYRDDEWYNTEKYYDVPEGAARIFGTYDEAYGTGLLEIFHNGTWGTVCKIRSSQFDEFDRTAASIVCRQIGFYSGVQEYRRGPYKNNGLERQRATGYEGQPIWLNNVRCSGNETSLLECQHDGIANHSCSHANDVNIRCKAEWLAHKG